MNPNLWKTIDTFKGFESEMKLILLSKALGRDLTANTGSKNKDKANLEPLRAITRRYQHILDKEYMSLLVHTLADQSSK